MGKTCGETMTTALLGVIVFSILALSGMVGMASIYLCRKLDDIHKSLEKLNKTLERLVKNLAR